MGRPAKFNADELLDASRSLVLSGGPSALSVSAVAAAVQAPGASVYHRFASRDALAASMWLRAVEHFQVGLAELLELDDPVAIARAAAQHVLHWSRNNVEDAQLLLLYRSSDFVSGEWPAELVDRNAAQRRVGSDFITELCRRLGATSGADKRRVVFAVVDIPYGAVRSSLGGGKRPSAQLATLIDDAATAVLNGVGAGDQRNDEGART